MLCTKWYSFPYLDQPGNEQTVVISDLRGKNAERKCFWKIQGLAIGKRIKDLKVWTATDHNKKGNNVTVIKTNFRVKYVCSLFCLAKLRKQFRKTKNKREHYVAPNFIVFILQTFTRFKKPCQAQTPQSLLIFANLCKYRLNKKTWSWQSTPVSSSSVFLKKSENLCYLQ